MTNPTTNPLDSEQLHNFVQDPPLSESDLNAIWEPIFGSFQAKESSEAVVIGQLGQSLDGRIATLTGDSKYINSASGLDHLHRLRALVDAVVIGVGTAQSDDPLLTVRRVKGTNPARIVIDPSAKLSSNAKIWAADGTRRLMITGASHTPDLPEGVEHIALETDGRHIAPQRIISALLDLGFKRILIEGGAETIGRFIDAGCMDRLHLIVAPVILGSGRIGLNLAAIEKVTQAIKPRVHIHRLGDDILFDCDLTSHRATKHLSKKSS